MTDTPKAPELMPCPFCGNHQYLKAEGYPLSGWRVFCDWCGSRTDGKAWNIRVPDALLAELGAEVSADSFFDLVKEARIEAAKAMHKFPQPTYVISKIAEEAGEVVKAAIHMAENRETPENLRGEMKQLIAMLYRLWVEGDGVHGLPSVHAALQEARRV